MFAKELLHRLSQSTGNKKKEEYTNTFSFSELSFSGKKMSVIICETPKAEICN
jgi:hypothetical protein